MASLLATVLHPAIHSQPALAVPTFRWAEVLVWVHPLNLTPIALGAAAMRLVVNVSLH